MILSDRDILASMKREEIIIDPFRRKSLQSSGYDLRFGGAFILDGKEQEGDCLDLPPKKYAILSTLETVGLVNLVGDLKLRSTFCREGLVGSFGWVDPGWIGVLSLSVTNAGDHTIRIRKGERFAQIVFMTLSTPVAQSYDGQYQGSTIPEASKRLKR
jgi:dCTP deaminase